MNNYINNSYKEYHDDNKTNNEQYLNNSNTNNNNYYQNYQVRDNQFISLISQTRFIKNNPNYINNNIK